MQRDFSQLQDASHRVSLTEWEDNLALRWLAQLTLGFGPGLIVLALIWSSAAQPIPESLGAHKVSIASIIPFLSATGLSESSAFHRLAAEESFAAAESVQFRTAAAHPPENAVPAIPVAVAEPVLTHNFSAPRTSWKLLDKGTRSEIKTLLSNSESTKGAIEVILHSAPNHGKTNQNFGRYLADVRGSATASCDVLIGDGSIEVINHQAHEGHLDITMAGNFSDQLPTEAQLAALDEVIDYITMHCGPVKLLQHLPANQGTTSCLGRKFPIRQIAAAVTGSQLR